MKLRKKEAIKLANDLTAKTKKRYAVIQTGKQEYILISERSAVNRIFPVDRIVYATGRKKWFDPQGKKRNLAVNSLDE